MDELMGNTSSGRKLEGEDVAPRPVQAQGAASRGRVDQDQHLADNRHSTDHQYSAVLTALARLLGTIAVREQVAASCREEGERDGT